MKRSITRSTALVAVILLTLTVAAAFAPPLAPALSRCSQAWRQQIVTAINQLETRVTALEEPDSPPSTAPATQPSVPESHPPISLPTTNPAAPITWFGADGTTERSLTIESPRGSGITTLPHHRGLDLSNRSDVTLTSLTLGELPPGCDAIHVGNGQISRRVALANLSVDASNYGIYLGGVHHWQLSDVAITKQAGSNEHALRMIGDHVLFQRVTLDSTRAGKRTVWCYGDDIAFIDCTLRGGAVWFGATPEAFPGAEQVSANRILIRGGSIEQTRRDMPAAIAILPGCDEVVFERVAITGPVDNRAADIDTRRMGSVAFRHCTWNGRALAKSDLRDDSGRAVVEP